MTKRKRKKTKLTCVWNFVSYIIWYKQSGK